MRRFETSAHLAYAAAQLVTFDLPMETFDRYVPGVEAVSPGAVLTAARAHIRPLESTVVVVGDAAGWRAKLDVLDRPVVEQIVEF